MRSKGADAVLLIFHACVDTESATVSFNNIQNVSLSVKEYCCNLNMVVVYRWWRESGRRRGGSGRAGSHVGRSLVYTFIQQEVTSPQLAIILFDTIKIHLEIL